MDDDAFVRELTVDLLLHVGVGRVEMANDGEEALHRLTGTGEVFTHALMDLQMPLMDGFEAVRRQRHAFPEPPILLGRARAFTPCLCTPGAPPARR